MCESEPRNTEDRYAVAVIRDSTMVRHQRRGRIVSVCLEDEKPSLQIHCCTLHAYIVMECSKAVQLRRVVNSVSGLRSTKF